MHRKLPSTAPVTATSQNTAPSKPISVAVFHGAVDVLPSIRRQRKAAKLPRDLTKSFLLATPPRPFAPSLRAQPISSSPTAASSSNIQTSRPLKKMKPVFIETASDTSSSDESTQSDEQPAIRSTSRRIHARAVHSDSPDKSSESEFDRSPSPAPPATPPPRRPKSSLVFKRTKAKPTHELNQTGCDAIYEVWARFAPRIRKHHPRSQIGLQEPDRGTKKEKRKMNALVFDLMAIKDCSCQSSTASSCSTRLFSSEAKLLDARLQ